MEKKSIKSIARFVFVLFAVTIIFTLISCEKPESKYLKDLEPLVIKLETSVRSEDFDNYKQIHKEITDLPQKEKYAELPNLTEFSGKNLTVLSSLTERISKAETAMKEIQENKVAGNTYMGILYGEPTYFVFYDDNKGAFYKLLTYSNEYSWEDSNGENKSTRLPENLSNITWSQDSNNKKLQIMSNVASKATEATYSDASVMLIVEGIAFAKQ